MTEIDLQDLKGIKIGDWVENSCLKWYSKVYSSFDLLWYNEKPCDSEMPKKVIRFLWHFVYERIFIRYKSNRILYVKTAIIGTCIDKKRYIIYNSQCKDHDSKHFQFVRVVLCEK